MKAQVAFCIAFLEVRVSRWEGQDPLGVFKEVCSRHPRDHGCVPLSFSSVGFLLNEHGLGIRIFFCWINHFIIRKYPFVPLVMFPSLKLRVCDVSSAIAYPVNAFPFPTLLSQTFCVIPKACLL